MRRFWLPLISLSLLVLFLLSHTTPVQANAGPPASIRFTIVHDGIEFDFDFLIPYEIPLSARAIEEARRRVTEATGAMQYDFYYQETFPEVLIDFQDQDMYVSNALYGSSRYFYRDRFEQRNEDVFSLYFTTPLHFKAAIVVDGEVYTSPPIAMTQFDFRITWDIRGVAFTHAQEDIGELSGFVPHPLTQLSTYGDFLIRLVFTLTVELALLWLFGFRKRSTFIRVGILNTLTQSLLNIATLTFFFLSHQSWAMGVMVLFVLGEIMVFLVETIFLALFVKERSLFRRVSFALVANTVTLIGGVFLMMWLFATIH